MLRSCGHGLGFRECPLVELVEKLILGVCDSLGADRCNLGGGLCLVDGTFGLGGEEGAVGLGVGVAFCDGSGDVGRARFGRGWLGDGGDGTVGTLGAASTMSGETLGCLLP